MERSVAVKVYQNTVDLLNSGSPVVRTWFLVRNNVLPFVICGLYTLITIYGPKIMKNRKPFSLQYPLIVYNFSLVIVYSVIVPTFLWCLPKATWYEICHKGLVIKGTPAYTVALISYTTYLMKYVELLDTVFFILRKKENQITFLHVLHHSILPIVGWILFRTEENALQIFPGMLNNTVHIVMYTYYGLSACGPGVRKYLWWKKYLTMLQIVQFVIIVIYAIVFPRVTGCSLKISSYLLNVVLGSLFLYLFCRFYKQAFSSVKSTSVKKID